MSDALGPPGFNGAPLGMLTVDGCFSRRVDASGGLIRDEDLRAGGGSLKVATGGGAVLKGAGADEVLFRLGFSWPAEGGLAAETVVDFAESLMGGDFLLE